MTLIAPALQGFFTDRLIGQHNASPHTIAAYRDTLRLLLTFASQRTGKPVSQLRIDDLGPGVITGFLDHLEGQRGNSVPTRNARLAAIHSLFRFAALAHPEHAASIARVLAIRPNATSERSSPSSPSRKSTRCSPRLTAARGPVDATMLFWCSPSRPGCESRS